MLTTTVYLALALTPGDGLMGTVVSHYGSGMLTTTVYLLLANGLMGTVVSQLLSGMLTTVYQLLANGLMGTVVSQLLWLWYVNNYSVSHSWPRSRREIHVVC